VAFRSRWRGVQKQMNWDVWQVLVGAVAGLVSTPITPVTVRFVLALIGLALIPMILAVIGNHLAASTVGDGRLQKLLKRWIWGLASLSIILTVASQYLAFKDANRHDLEIDFLKGRLQVLNEIVSASSQGMGSSLRELVHLHRIKPQAPADSRRDESAETIPEDPLLHLTNDVVKQKTIELAQKMREFEKAYKIKQIDDLMVRPPYSRDATQEERRLAWELETMRTLRRSTERQTEFRNQFSSEALNLEESLLARLGKTMPSLEERPPALPYGMLVGPSPVSDAADYLERMARQL